MKTNELTIVEEGMNESQERIVHNKMDWDKGSSESNPYKGV